MNSDKHQESDIQQQEVCHVMNNIIKGFLCVVDVRMQCVPNAPTIFHEHNERMTLLSIYNAITFTTDNELINQTMTAMLHESNFHASFLCALKKILKNEKKDLKRVSTAALQKRLLELSKR